MNTKSEAKKRFSEKFKAYSSIDKAKEWVQNNFHLISGMFENVKIRDFIFEPFYRVDKSRRQKSNNYGLGLNLCKSIMEAHNGVILVESESGSGSIFILEFPREWPGEEVKKDSDLDKTD